MKKLHTLLVALFVCCATLQAYDAKIDGIYYNFSGNEAAVTCKYYSENYCYSDYSGNVVIPESVTYRGKAYRVTSLGEYAFCESHDLSSVTIPSSVNKISEGAFSNCGLTSITIPNSVTSIGDFAFVGTALTSVVIPNSVTRIGICVFSGCFSLTSVTIPESVTSIGDYAFIDCCSLDSVTIPESVTSIGDGAFRFCENLTSITIPNSVTSVGQEAFWLCSGLTSVIIGDGVTSIREMTFSDCTSLTSVTIGSSVTSIEDDAFFGCTSLTSVNINDLAAWCKIEFQEFLDCNPLYYAHHLYLNGKEIKDLVIPDGVESISDWAFCGCTGLTSVTIPESVTSIDRFAFYDCTSLTSVHINDLAAWCKINFYYYFCNPLYYAHHLYLNGKELKDLVIPDGVTGIGDCTFSGCTSLTSVTIPNGVTIIGHYAFRECTGLTSVTIGSDVKDIGAEALGGCLLLTTLICNAITPPFCSSGSFDDFKRNCVLYVPKESINRYKENSNWRDFLHIEDADGIYPVNACPRENGGNDIYDIFGRKVAETKNGLYIINGRKVLVK